MAFYGKPKKKQGTSVRLTGLFKTKKRGLFVGSVDEKEAMTDVVKQAIQQNKGIVFFLWRNNEAEEGAPLYTLYMDVSQDEGSRPKRREIVEPDDEPEDEPEDERPTVKADWSTAPSNRRKSKPDDEVPF